MQTKGKKLDSYLTRRKDVLTKSAREVLSLGIIDSTLLVIYEYEYIAIVNGVEKDKSVKKYALNCKVN